VLATDPYPEITSFAIDDASVYWTTLYTGTDGGIAPKNGTVSKCPLAGCTGAPTLLATNQDFPQSIIVSGSTLYWLDYNAASLRRCGLDCNDDAATFYQWPAIWSGGFAANGTEVFLSGANGAGLVDECPSSACTTPTPFATGQETPDDMAIGGTSLYWIDYGTLVGGKNLTYVDAGVMTCPLGGCDGGVTALATGLSYPGNLVVNGAAAYWTQGNSVATCSVAGCNGAPTTIVTLGPSYDSVQGLAADGANVYFGTTTTSSGTRAWEIQKCALSGCPDGATLLSSTTFSSGGPVSQIAVDGARVYFVSADGSQILAVAK
jgi:hypothetical protein